VQGVVEARYTCCQSTLDVRGCVVSGRHITQTLRLSTLEQYVSTPKPYGIGDPRSTKVYKYHFIHINVMLSIHYLGLCYGL
jgi:hypothetical protein